MVRARAPAIQGRPFIAFGSWQLGPGQLYQAAPAMCGGKCDVFGGACISSTGRVNLCMQWRAEKRGRRLLFQLLA